ncbi:hypothetical protein FXO38_21615 [Capsicum annuum]|nr:hypothetical protein FXO38_21615 [Capsicum annuum]
MKVDEGEEVTELEENLWDPAECLPMLGHGLETESEGLITPHVSIYAMNDMLVLPIRGCNMVLGIQWLATLGDVMWNFRKLRMEFTIMGHKVSLRGIKPPAAKLVQPEKMEKLLAKPAELCMISIGMYLEKQVDVNTGEILIMERDQLCIEKNQELYPIIQKDEIEKLVDEMLEDGIIRHSTSPYSSPIVMVKKNDGSWRMCVDYKELNSCTIMDKFPIPVIEELLDELPGEKFFSKLDLRSGCHQIRMVEGDILKTTFQTHHGHYEFLVMPFGFTNAPSTFQSLMNHIFHSYLRKFILLFFDDILIYSQTWNKHLQHLQTTLEILRSHVLFVKKSKCEFGVLQIDYLGHVISVEGVSMDMHKVESVLNWPPPTNLNLLRGFLGLVGYYRRFIKGYGTIARPLNNLLKKGNFKWNDATDTAFKKLKKAITSAPILALPDFFKEFMVETDASGEGIGAMLVQENKTIAFFSQGLSDRNKALAVYERKLLAVVTAVQKWRSYLLGRPFVIKTDHHKLKYLLEQRITTPSQQKWLIKLLGFDYSIQYKKGKDNVVADALSRKKDVIQLMSISRVQE